MTMPGIHALLMQEPKRVDLKSKQGANLKGCTHYLKLRKRGIGEILAMVEPKEVLEEVICEPDKGDFLGLEREEVVNDSI